MKGEGHHVVDVTFPASRISVANVELIRQKYLAARGRIHTSIQVITVIQLFDNAYYFCRGKDGSLTPGVKLTDGRHHVIGDSILAPKELQFHAFKQLLPLLNAATGTSLVLVPPLPRYWSKGCCGAGGHVTNLKAEGYQDELEAAIHSCKSNLKDFSFTSGIKNCKVIAAWAAIKKLPEIWADPVHLSREAYVTLAKVAAACAPSCPHKREATPGPPPPPPKKPRQENYRHHNPYRGGSSSSWNRGYRGRRGHY